MKKEVKKLENSQIELVLSFEGEEWTNAQKKSFNKLVEKLTLPGFRKGHVPANIAKSKINQAEVLNEAIDIVLQPAYELSLKEENIVPFLRPELSVTKISEKELEAKIVVTTAPEVKLGDYKGLHIEKSDVKVADEDIDAEIKKLAEQNAELVVKEDVAAMGDTVNIDFEGFVGNEPFDGGKGTNYNLELGSHSFIPGFEEQVVGLKAGDKKDIAVKFPEQYVKELAGKDATFKLTVNEVKAKKVPEVGADLIADLQIEGVGTVEELKNHVKADLLAKGEQEAKSKYYGDLLAKIRESSTIAVADAIIMNEVDSMKENFKKQVEQNGLTLEQYYQITNTKPEDTEAKMKVEAEINIKNFLVLEEIAKAEKISITQEEVNAELQKIADQYKMPLEKVTELLKPQMNQFVADQRGKKISEFLFANNN